MRAFRILPSSTTSLSFSAQPIAWSVPPSICPLHRSGLMAFPTSWTAQKPSTVVSNVSRSTSTSAMSQPHANTGYASPRYVSSSQTTSPGVSYVFSDTTGSFPVRAKRSRAARSTIEPTIITVRDATVGPESGTTEVDGVANSTRSIETQSASADLRRRRADPEKRLFPRRATQHVDCHPTLQPAFARAREARSVQEDARADAASLAGGGTARRAPAKQRGDRPRGRGRTERGTLLVPSARLSRLLDAALDADRLLQELARRRRVADPEEVLLAQLERVGGQLARDSVHVPLDGPDRLRRSEASEGAVRRRVRGDRDGLDRDVLPAVGAGRVEGGAREDDRSQRDVRTAVHEDPDRDGRQVSLAVAAGLDRHLTGMALRRRLDVLLPVVDHLHGPAALLREQEGMESEKRGVLLLPAESAARHGLRHVHVRVVEAERALDTLVNVERALQRAHQMSPVGVPEREHALRLDVELLLMVRAVPAGQADRTRSDRLGGVAFRDPVCRKDVVRPVNLGLSRERVGDREDGWQGLDLGRERAQGTGEADGILGRHERDRLVSVAHFVGSEDGLVLLDERDDVHRHVLGGHDRHARPVERGIPSDASQTPPRHRTAEGRAEEGARSREIVDVAGRPGDLRRSIRARNAAANEGHASASRDVPKSGVDLGEAKPETEPLGFLRNDALAIEHDRRHLAEQEAYC